MTTTKEPYPSFLPPPSHLLLHLFPAWSPWPHHTCIRLPYPEPEKQQDHRRLRNNHGLLSASLRPVLIWPRKLPLTSLG